MKIAIFLIALTTAFAAQATQVGDFAVYTFTYKTTADISTMPTSEKQTVTAVDLANKYYEIERVTTLGNGTVQTTQERLDVDPTVTTESMCTNMPGATVEKIATPAGEFVSCLVQSLNGEFGPYKEARFWFLSDFPAVVKTVLSYEDSNGAPAEVTVELTALNGQL